MNIRKAFILALFGVILGLLSITLAQNAQDTADINNVFQIVVNNTNLAPDAGAPHPLGTGERVSGGLYWANTTPIQIMLLAHANTAGQNAQINLSINGTETLVTALRPLAIAEDTHTTLNTIIPKGANYSVAFSNYHHYEWREYPILSGKNGTLSINQSIFNTFNNYTNTTVNNASIQINESQVTNLTKDLNAKVNKSGDTITGTLEVISTTKSEIIFADRIYNLAGSGILLQDSDFGRTDRFIIWGNTGVIFPVRLINTPEYKLAGLWFNNNSNTLKIGGRWDYETILSTNSSLTGSGDAFLCVHANASLYRSGSPCV